MLGAFISALAGVRRAVAARCVPGARLVIRFWALPSAKVSPQKLMIASLRGAGWMTRDSPAGAPSRASAPGRAVQRQLARYRPGR